MIVTDWDRFLRNKIEISPNGCWNWTGRLSEWGYAKINSKVWRTTKGHRIAYMVWRGAIPEGMCVCHRCDNPKCINPDHLFLDTNAGNTADKVRKGRQAGANGERKGEGNPAAKFTNAQAAAIRDQYKNHPKEGRRASMQRMADAYGVSLSTIEQIANGRRYGNA